MTIKLNNQTKGVTLGLLVLAVALFAFAFRGIFFGESEIGDRESVTLERVARHPLSGEWLNEAMELPRVYGVMVENHLDSRPQSGLDQALLVMEAPVEARLPRLLAFFSEEQGVEKIGPVRSARPYYLDWNAELDAVYAHVGGSPAALALLQADDTIDIDEFANEWFFWRADEMRSAPHNVYTSLDLLGDALERFESRFGAEDNAWDSWTFKEDAEARALGGTVVASVPSVTIDFADEPYVIEWRYRAGENVYRRFQGGELHEMEDGALIDANNIVVMETDVEILDSIGRRRVPRPFGRNRPAVNVSAFMIARQEKKSP
ncbi:MAG: hypothetical protein UY82_C0024G0007 [Candidatus Uhrbacteria bacterium GW2011_GWC2_53_7]|uniref:Uncharacterized protein n=1 Tax=Candidatus Uhrbacteria bacterium GW2011_GWC2_53_7 TaxID=1618986 RepID=A0A0G1XZ48_9BACT|nr:MAG: hypothetical protein UY82_C0024G0007 [Candidatus Uhrbacteria bacterium GW2011_GWC2_53_7]